MPPIAPNAAELPLPLPQPTLAYVNAADVPGLVLTTYAVYLLTSIALTVWVARILQQHGRVFLVRAFREDEALADSINRLLVVGFYLVNIGWIALMLRIGIRAHDLRAAVETVTTKIGIVLVLLGVLHFINVVVFNRMRKGAIRP